MKRFALPLLIVTFAVVGGVGGFLLGGHLYDNPPAPPGVAQVARGEPVPDIALSDPDGGERRLSQWRGRLLLVNYWASWCAPCVEEMPMLDRFAAKHAARGLAVVGIAEDDAEAVRRFLSRHPVGYPILLGRRQIDGSSVQLGNSRGVLPFTALIDADGRLLDRRVGALDEAKLEAWLADYWPDS